MTTSTHIPNRYRVTSVTLTLLNLSFSCAIISSFVARDAIPDFPQKSILYPLRQSCNGLATASVKPRDPLAHEFLHFFTSHLSTTLPSPQSNKCNKVTQLCERGTFRHRSYILLMCFRLFCQRIQKLIFRGWGKADVAVLVE